MSAIDHSAQANAGSDKKNIQSPDATGPEEPVRKKDKYRKPKPWDNDPTLDKWAIEEFKPEHNPNGMVDESSFSCLFP